MPPAKGDMLVEHRPGLRPTRHTRTALFRRSFLHREKCVSLSFPAPFHGPTTVVCRDRRGFCLVVVNRSTIAKGQLLYGQQGIGASLQLTDSHDAPRRGKAKTV